MRVCLVSAPSIAEFSDLGAIAGEDTPRIPLGILCLAAALERTGVRPEVVDLDLLNEAWRTSRGGGEDFALHAAAHLAWIDSDVYGLSTMCGSYPLTLRIAAALRRARPACRIVLGGPQATATAAETLAAFPAVDVVVRGEGERVLCELLAALDGKQDLSAVHGLTFRTARGIERTPDAPPLQNLDALAPPDYRPYLRGKRYGSVPLEVGRGCPFCCTFCSTSRFFGRRYRVKSPARIVGEMLALLRTFGVRSFDLVHDNFTADRRRVVAFCEAVSAVPVRLTWTCSSRADCLDDDLIEVMHHAGCRGVFLGIESGSDAIQASTNKRLDLDRTRALLRSLSRRKIRATLSLITGFPEETWEDVERTTSFFVDSLRHDYLEPQLTLLAPLAGTPIHARHRDELVRDTIVSDIAFQGEALDPRDRALVDRHPEVFSSFYGVPTRWLDRQELGWLRAFLLHARFDLRWLLVAVAQLEGGGLRAFLAFRAWQAARAGRAARAPWPWPTFRRDFLGFVREDLVRRHPAAAHALNALVRYYGATARRNEPSPSPSAAGSRPIRARNLQLTRIGCDGAALIECLRSGSDLRSVPRRRSVLVTRQLTTHDQLVRITEEAGELLLLCDGTRDVDAIARAFRRGHPAIGGTLADAAVRVGLELFLRKGLVTLPAARRRAAAGAPSSLRAEAGRRPRPSSVPARAPARRALRRNGPAVAARGR